MYTDKTTPQYLKWKIYCSKYNILKYSINVNTDSIDLIDYLESIFRKGIKNVNKWIYMIIELYVG